MKQKLQDQLVALELFSASPLGAEYISGLRSAEEQLTHLIVNDDVASIPQVFAHFTSIGHLRGLRIARQNLEAAIETTKQELKDL